MNKLYRKQFLLVQGHPSYVALLLVLLLLLLLGKHLWPFMLRMKRESRNKAAAHGRCLIQIVIVLLRLQWGFILKLRPSTNSPAYLSACVMCNFTKKKLKPALISSFSSTRLPSQTFRRCYNIYCCSLSSGLYKASRLLRSDFQTCRRPNFPSLSAITDMLVMCGRFRQMS